MFSVNVFAQESKVQIPVSLASQLNKTISLDLTNVQIEDVLKNISLNYGVNFTYVNNDIPLNQIVNIQSKNQTLSLVLDQIFQGTLVKYYEIETQILLKKEDEILATASSSDSSQKSASKTLKALQNSNPKARYSTIQNGKYKLHFSIGNLFRLNFNTFKRPVFGNNSFSKSEPLDSLDKLLKDSTLTKKQKRTVKKYKRVIVNRAKPFYRLALGAYAAPERTYRSLSGSNSDYVTDRNKFEDWQLNYSAGLSMDYFFSRHFFIRTGVSYLKFGETGRYQIEKPYLQPNQVTNTDTVISYKNNYSTLGIPLLLGFKTNRRLNIGISTGIVIGLFPQQQTTYPQEHTETYTYTSEYVQNPSWIPRVDRPNQFPAPNSNPPTFPKQQPAFRTEAGPIPPPPVVYSVTTTAYYYLDYVDSRKHDLRQINYIYNLNFDLGYRISTKFQIALSPSFYYFITSKYVKSDNMKEYPYSLGLRVGAFYFFGKSR